MTKWEKVAARSSVQACLFCVVMNHVVPSFVWARGGAKFVVAALLLPRHYYCGFAAKIREIQLGRSDL